MTAAPPQKKGIYLSRRCPFVVAAPPYKVYPCCQLDSVTLAFMELLAGETIDRHEVMRSIVPRLRQCSRLHFDMCRKPTDWTCYSSGYAGLRFPTTTFAYEPPASRSTTSARTFTTRSATSIGTRER